MATLLHSAPPSPPNSSSLMTPAAATTAPPPTTAPAPTTACAASTAPRPTTALPSTNSPPSTNHPRPTSPLPSTTPLLPTTPPPPVTAPISTTTSPPMTGPTPLAAPITTTAPITMTASTTTTIPTLPISTLIRNIVVATIRSELCSAISLVCATLTLVMVLYKDSYYSAEIDESDTALEWSLYSFWSATFVWFVVARCMALQEGRRQRQQAPFVPGPPCERPTDFILRLLWCVLAGVVAHLVVVPAINATTTTKTTLRKSLLLFMPFVLTLAAIGSAMKSGPRPPASDVERPQVELSSLLPSGQSSAGTPLPIDNPD